MLVYRDARSVYATSSGVNGQPRILNNRQRTINLHQIEETTRNVVVSQFILRLSSLRDARVERPLDFVLVRLAEKIKV